MRSGIISLYQNKAPIYEMLSGASIAFAAILLIIPGFFTDLLGFLLLIPFTRNFIFKKIFIQKKQASSVKKNEKIINGEIIDKNKDEI